MTQKQTKPENKSNRKATKSNAETKKQLAEDLENAGISESTFQNGRKSYNVLFSKQRTKDIGHWYNIGCVGVSIKDHLKDTKNNPNTGQLKHIFSTYFPRVSDNDRGRAIWLASHYPEIMAFVSENNWYINHPGNLRAALLKHLKVEKAPATEFEKYGLNKPKEKAPVTPTDKTGKQSTNETGVVDSEIEKVMKKAGVTSLVNHLESIVDLLEGQKKTKYEMSHLEKLDALATRLGDIVSYFEDYEKYKAKKKAA